MLDKNESAPEEYIGGGLINNSDFKIDYDHFKDRQK